jgi:hypothetical protein
MGLKCSGKNGVKAQLLSRFPQAFREFESLVDARDASHAEREETFSCIDGNVILMSVPRSATKLDDYVAIVTASLKRAISTCFVTIVVFDEPSAMTEAKVQEQMKRDAARAATSVACSADIQVIHPTDDNYTKEFVEQSQDVHPLVENRGSRGRFFDEVAARVLCNLNSQIERWNASGYKGGHVLFDGVDPRGADRPLGQSRDAGVVGSCERLVDLFRRQIAIGEGDMKLADLGRRVRALSEAGDDDFGSSKLSLVTTIDTDSFAIELIEEAKRVGQKESKPHHTLLCMRERARKRGADDERPAFFLCCDISMLHGLLQRAMWGLDRSPSPIDQHAAITLMAAGWATAGCDFLSLKGMRSDLVFDAMPVVVKTIPEALESIKFCFTGKREDMDKTHQAIRALAMTCASKLMDIPRVKKDVLPSIRNPDDMIVRRAAWTAAYWNSIEHKGAMDEFGFFASHSL